MWPVLDAATIYLACHERRLMRGSAKRREVDGFASSTLQFL